MAKKIIIKDKPKTSTRKKAVEEKSQYSVSMKIGISVAVITLCCTLFTTMALVSYMTNWQSDQVFADINMVGSSEIEAMNICGPYGAYIGYMIIGQWFGIAGLLLPIPFFAVAIYLLNSNARFFLKLIISTITGIMILPTALTFMTPYADPSTLGGGYGGGYGVYLNNMLRSTIGPAGTVITLILTFSIWLIYSFPYSFRWYIYMSKKIKSSANVIGEKINNTETPDVVTSNATKDSVVTSNTSTEDDTNIKTTTEDEIVKMKYLSPMILVEGEDLSTIATGEENSKNIIEIDDTTFTLKVNMPENDEDEIDIDDKSEIVAGTLAPDGGFTTKYDGGYGSFELGGDINTSENITDVNDANTPKNGTEDDNKYNFKISVTDNAVIEDKDLGNNIIAINKTDEIFDNESDQTIFDPTKELSRYKLPPLTLLDNVVSKINVTNEELKENTKKIVDTLLNFNIKIDDIEANIGPTVTLYEIRPAPGVRISTIKRLEDDIALSLAAHGIRIIAPIPGKDTVGIEVPNKNKEIVSMYSVIKTVDFQESDAELPIVLGKTIQNKPYIIDLAKMPHLLVAGATGQGKSVGLNAIITSLLYKKHPAELKFVMVDPKKVEFSIYSALEKHYLAKLPDEEEPIIIDTQKVIHTLNSLCLEMDTRYELLKKAKVRNIKEYNGKFKLRKLNPNNGHKFLPYFVVIIDEFGDLILTAGKEIETPLTRLAALARAVGIHLVIATQRPTTNIITGSIKANFPARMAFRVISGIDSKTIIDSTGANQLIGKGDMLILANNETTRVQCAFIDTPEVERITDFIENQVGYGCAYPLPEIITEDDSDKSENRIISQRDALFDKIARYVVTNQQGSTSTIQRNFEIGFNRAGRIMDQLERAGVVGKVVGSKPRQVLIGDLSQLELHLINIDNPQYNY